jgi:hypothetical protein
MACSWFFSLCEHSVALENVHVHLILPDGLFVPVSSDRPTPRYFGGVKAGGGSGRDALVVMMQPTDLWKLNDQWRICFRFVDGDAFDVEITDYH